MTEFAVGVVSSLCASALLVVAGWLRTRSGRAWLIRLLSALTGLGIDRRYTEQRLASADLAADLARARWVKVLAGRGNELTRDTFRHVWPAAGGRLESVEILLPDPEPGDGWLCRREREIARYDPGYAPGLLAAQINTTIRYVWAVAADHQAVTLRLFDLPHTQRLIITDDVAYVTPYPVHRHGRNAPCFVFRTDSPFYDHALRLFTAAWQASRSPQSDRSAEQSQRSRMGKDGTVRRVAGSTRPASDWRAQVADSCRGSGPS